MKERLSEIISNMNSDIDVALVEGKRDRKALRSLGFYKPIINCSSLTGEEVVEKLIDLEAKYIALLTDFDSHGRGLFKGLTETIERRGIRIKSLYRKKIKEVLDEKNMKTIEAMNNL